MTRENFFLNYSAAVQRRLRSVTSELAHSIDAVPSPVAPASAPAAQPSPEKVAQALVRAEEAAALSGRCSPDELCPSTAGAALQLAVLSALAPACAVETIDNQVQWRMLHAPRQKVLGRLHEQNLLQQRLQGPLPATDRLGVMLREVLRKGEQLSLKRRSAADLTALSAAIEALGELPLPHPDTAVIRRLLAKPDDFLDNYGLLLKHGFVGRAAELASLRAFLAQPNVGLGSWSGLVLTGIGGVGKSTLLAKFIHVVLNERLATLAVLDFDRPGMDAADRDWLDDEIARQVGRQYPAALEALREVRYQARAHKTEGLESVLQSGLEATSELRTRTAVIAGVRTALSDAGVAELPFLLVLDTFEEVTRNSELLSPFESWLYTLADALAPTPLKVILSGRLFGTPVEKWVQTHIPLAELDLPLAARLLTSRGVPKPTAQRLVASKLLPLRPLELILLARILVDDPDTSIDKLEAELQQAPAADGATAAIKELAIGVIYRRVLNRLKDPIAARLAYPGMVLRYLTPELIRAVLSPVLGLSLDEAEATRVLDVLASNTWITYREGNEVWHRKDLRRMMIRLISGAERLAADAISRAASAFFSQRSGDKDWVEAIYHRLMLTRTPAEGETLELADLHRAAQALGADVADLPRAATALLQFAVDGSVAMEDVEVLPTRYLPRAYGRNGRRLVNAGEFGKALKLFRRGRQEQLAIEWESDAPLPWELETLFATVSWRDLIGVELPPTTESTLKALTAQLFPAELLGMAQLSTTEFEERFSRALDDPGLSNELRSPQIGTILTRLALALLCRHHRRPLSVSVRRAFLAAATAMMSRNHRSLSAILERRLVLLRLGTSTQQPLKVHLAPSTLKLDKGWLTQVRAFAGTRAREVRQLLSEAHATLERVLQGKQRTARRVLSSLDALYKERKRWSNAALTVNAAHKPKTLLTLLRGPDPEFRNPCCFALLELDEGRVTWRRLARIIASVLPFSLDDLEPDTFADLVAADPEHRLDVYVELIDRSWKLGDFMRRVVNAFPQARKMVDLLDAYNRWDAAVHAALTTPKPHPDPTEELETMSAPITPNYVAFDEGGNFVDFAAFDAVLATTPTDPGPTDVFVFSHGWNNNFADASQTYGAVIGQMTNVADRVSGLRPDPFRPLAFGVIWPSKAWDDGAGGAFESTVPFASSDLVAAVYENLSPQRASPAGYRHDVMRVQQLVLKNTLDASETTEFLGLLRRHADPATAWAQDNLFDQPNPEEGLEGLTLPSFSPGDLFRIFTYWQMKKRAGVVGGTGVRALIAAVQNRFSAARIHLLGHSFGCKVMLAALAGSGTPLPRAVQTVVLLQGAVSYQALANQVIGTDSPGGYRAVLEQSRVDGPIVVTFSQFDKACSEAYPLASRAANQTGELEGVLDRFRAMGAIGAFDIGPGLEQRTPMRQEGDAYQFRNRGVWSVDGGDPALITGHSDIRTPQIAWLIWSAIRRR